MAYQVYVNSQFPGTAGITQVFDDESFPITDGSNCLDSAEWYPSANPNYTNLVVINTNVLSSNQLALSDGPWEKCNINKSTNTMVIIQYRDYARFQPNAGNPSNNIFVTLGKITWNVNAQAAYVASSNVWTMNAGSGVTNITLDAGSTEWPFWTNVFTP